MGYYPQLSVSSNINTGFLGFGWEIENLYVKVTNKMQITNTVKKDVIDYTSKKLGAISIPLGSTGFAIEGGIQVVIKAGGEISVEFTTVSAGGFSYEKDIGIRTIKETNTNITPAKFEAKASFGIRPLLMLTLCSVWDIADIGLEIGPAGVARATIRDSKTTCFDISLYLYMELNALTDSSILGEFLPYTLSVSIFDDENSPYKIGRHIETTTTASKVVPKCTFGTGKFKAFVVDYSTNIPLDCVLDANRTGGGGVDTQTVKITAKSGYIISDEVKTGTYSYTINAPGYLTYSGNMSVTLDATTNIGTIKLIKVGNGTISGTVKNALNSSAVSGAKLTLYKGADISATNVSSAQVATFTGSDTTTSTGVFNVGIINGYYTLKVEKEGYITGYHNVTSAFNSPAQNIVLIPTNGGGSSETNIGDLRVVLTWGASPADLDSHLCGPTASGIRRFHTFYADKTYSENGTVHAFLDVDDTTSYGPETTTVWSSTIKPHTLVNNKQDKGMYKNGNKVQQRIQSRSDPAERTRGRCSSQREVGDRSQDTIWMAASPTARTG